MRANRSIREIVIAACVFGACVEGGTNFNQKAPGNGATGGGITIGLGDVAVSPDGKYFASVREEKLMIGDPRNCGLTPVSGVAKPNRIAFAPGGSLAFVSSVSSGKVYAVRLASSEVAWSTEIPLKADSFGERPELRPSPDGTALLLVGDDLVVVVDAATGALSRTYQAARRVVDADFLADGEVLLTLDHEWMADDAPQTQLVFWSLSDGTTSSLAVPNCASRLTVSASSAAPSPRLERFWASARAGRVAEAPARLRVSNARYAFIAPTRCQKDPISVIDVNNRLFVENLPGFGPVTLSPDGTTAIGFFDRGALESPRYDLMFVNTQTLEWEFVLAGDQLPRYVFTPDGAVLLVDSAGHHARILDVEERSFRALQGPQVRLDDFALTSDSRSAWVASSGGLYAVDLPAAKVTKRDVAFTVNTLNIAPDDAVLYLHDDQQGVRLYEPATGDERCRVAAILVRPSDDSVTTGR